MQYYEENLYHYSSITKKKIQNEQPSITSLKKTKNRKTNKPKSQQKEENNKSYNIIKYNRKQKLQQKKLMQQITGSLKTLVKLQTSGQTH